jgi:putative ABC transport system permease protein
MARQSVIELEQRRSRPVEGPFWYRYYLDLLLILPTAYAYQQLSRRGTLALLVQDRPQDLYQDPLLILVPGLFIVTAALVTMRLFPLVMRLADYLAGQTPWTTLHLALRQLGRQSESYINPLLLVIVALALGVYTLSMAASLDQWLVDRVYYEVGTDLTFTPYPEESEAPPAFSGAWIPIPEQFLELPGAAAATRVGRFPMELTLSSGNSVRGRFMGVDRVDLPAVAWFRDDFAREPLGALMNRLAILPENLLVSQRFLNEHHLDIGDQLHLRLVIEGEMELRSLFTIAGIFTYFPTVDEYAWPTMIGNLDYVSAMAGVTAPHRIWLRLQEGTQGESVLEVLPQQMDIVGIQVSDAQASIARERAAFARVGIFGTLSMGFLAAVLIAGLGLLVYSYASLRERVYRFSVLHAVGLLYRQIIAQVALEYTAVTAYGAVAGTVTGAAAAWLFVPFFTVTGERRVPLPPLIPVIAQRHISAMGATFAVIMATIAVVVIVVTVSRRRFEMLRVRF